MLESASDYKCLDVSAYGGRVSGAVMPALIAGGNFSGVPRIEDALFLQEAYLQRRNWNIAPAKVLPECVEFLRWYPTFGSYYFGPSDSFVSQNYISAEVELPGDHFDGSGEVLSTPVAGMLDGVHPYDGLNSLDRDIVLRRYHNMGCVRRASVGFSVDKFVEKITQTTTSFNSAGEVTGTSVRDITSRLSSISFYYVSSSTNFRSVFVCSDICPAPWAVLATLYARVSVQTGDATHSVWIRLACPIVAGVVKAPDLSVLGERAAALAGCSYHQSPISSDEYVRMRFEFARLVVDNEFSAEVSSTGWKY